MDASQPQPSGDLRAVIFGATGGVGGALVRQLDDADRYDTVYAGARNLAEAAENAGTAFTFDLTDEASIMQAAALIGQAGPLDLVIVATGTLHSADQPMPEKSWRTIDGAAMARMFAINTIGPALIAKHFLPLMRRDRRAVFAVLSARVGSITDNRLGGWHSYRSSKAALNMLVRNFAIEFTTRNPQGIVVAIHPGTVDTALSKPFQHGISKETLFPPEVSAAHILAAIARFSAGDSGGLFAWDFARLPY